MDKLTDETFCKGVTASQSKTDFHTLLRLGRGGGGVHIHKGLGAADIAEGDFAQPFQLHIAHTVRASPLSGSQLAQLIGSKLSVVSLLVLVQICLNQ